MHRIAFIIGDRFLYWTPILIALGAAAAICMFLALHMGRTGKLTASFVAVPVALVLSLLLGRLLHWLCAPQQYGSFAQALGSFGIDGFALTGVVLGSALAACFVRLLGLTKDLPSMLDAMSLAGLFGIAVGRLNHFFNTADRGVAGQPIFRYQAVAAGVLFALLLVFFFTLGRKRPGDTCLLAGLFYGALQAVLDSLRQDALTLPQLNGLHLTLVGGSLLVLASLGLILWKLIRIRGWKWWYFGFLIPIAGVLSFAEILLASGQNIRHAALLMGIFLMLSLALYGLYLLGEKKMCGKSSACE